ncbi:hypothetical protein RQP46_003117 [Phenoliferia psychrophenolica]
MNIGTLMSTYQDDADGLEGLPIGLQEYYAPFPDDSGDILLLAMPISKIFRNAIAPNPTNMTLTVADQYGLGDGNLAAGRMRVALFGTLERVQDEEWDAAEAAYLAAHPDSRGWIPPNGPHSAYYARLRVQKVYAFNGFGNVAYIGWLPLELYKAAGALMRSPKDVHRHWPVPEQPEPDFGATDSLFAESAVGGAGRSKGEDRLVVQL